MSIVFLFPGQGSQKVNMLSDYAEHYPVILDTFTESSDALGFDIWQLCQDEQKVNETQYTQPALLTASIAIWRLWHSLSGKTPSLLAGHSLGEYSALTAAGALSLADAVTLVHLRGKLMQDAVPVGQGAMAAVLGKTGEQVADYCTQVNADPENTDNHQVSPANFNCQGQVVVSGHSSAVTALAKLAEEEKFRLMTLPVSVPSHCALMLPAAEKLAEAFAEVDFHDAKIPVVQNVDAEARTDATAIKQALLKQLSEPVLWQQTMQFIQGQGMTAGVECGAGKVLAGLAKRQKLDFAIHTTDSVKSFDSALTHV